MVRSCRFSSIPSAVPLMSVNLPEALAPSSEEMLKARIRLMQPTPGAPMGTFNRSGAEDFLRHQGWEGLIQAGDTDVDAQRLTMQAGILLHCGLDPRDPVFRRDSGEAARACHRRLRMAHQRLKLQREGVTASDASPEVLVALAGLLDAWQEAALADHLGVDLREVRAQEKLPFPEVKEKVLHFREMRNQQRPHFPRQQGERPESLLERLLWVLESDFPEQAAHALPRVRREVAEARLVLEQERERPNPSSPGRGYGR